VNGKVELAQAPRPRPAIAYRPVTTGGARAVKARHPPQATPLSWLPSVLLDDDPTLRTEVTAQSVVVDFDFSVPAAPPTIDRTVLCVIALAWALLVATLGLALPLG
jgi:hypothetical protein